jgi:molybdate transport system substrate-binding protein
MENLMPNTDTRIVAVFTANSMRGVLDTHGPAFERASGYTLDVSYDPAKVMLRRIAGGESADAAILGSAAIDTLIEQGKIERESRRALARCGVGVAVRAGARKPDVSSVEALKKTLLETKSIIFTTEGASGIHFSGLIEKLGIADIVKAKAHRQTGGLVAEVLARGEVELAVQQIPELLAVPGVDLVGPLPEPLQAISVSACGIFTNAKQRDGARALLDFLATGDAMRVFREKGHEPA